jgi:RNA polymerase sigma-70 factor (ECF subfamily)
MPEWSDSRTSITLLETLRQTPKDAEAWERFVWRYRPMIYGWCREWGLQGADADDVAQDVLAKLTEKLGHFRYDSSRCFRAWLKTVTQHAWSDSISSRLRGADARLVERLESLEAQADLKRRFEESFDREAFGHGRVGLRLEAPGAEAAQGRSDQAPSRRRLKSATG